MFEGHGGSVGDIELGLPFRRCLRICKWPDLQSAIREHSILSRLPSIPLNRLIAFRSNWRPSDVAEEPPANINGPSSVLKTFTATIRATILGRTTSDVDEVIKPGDSLTGEDSLSTPLEPRHDAKAKAKKAKPIIVDHPGDPFSAPSLVSRSPVLSNRAASRIDKEDRDGGEKRIEGRAFFADAYSVLSGRLPAPPSSRDGIPSQKATIRGPFRRKADDTHLRPRSYASTEIFDDHYSKPSQNSWDVPVGSTRMQSVPLSVGGAGRRISDNGDGSEYYESPFADWFSYSYHGPSLQPSATSIDERQANSTKYRDTEDGERVVTALKEDRLRSSAEEKRPPDLLDDTSSTDSNISYASGFGVPFDSPRIGFESEIFRPPSPSELKRFEHEDPLPSVGGFTHGLSHQHPPPSALPLNSRVVPPTTSKRRDIGGAGSGHGNRVVTALTMERSKSSAGREKTSTKNKSPKSRAKKLVEEMISSSRSKANKRQRVGEMYSSRPSEERKTSGAVKTTTSFFAGIGSRSNIPSLTASQRDSWISKPSKYICEVIHPCEPPAGVSYYSFPFFRLLKGNLYEVLQEAGHPSFHPKLQLYVDDGEDCLLLCRDGDGIVGWALASFLEPVS